MYMERVLSVEEKIRRAEEIYNKRNGGDVSTYSTKENNKPSLIHRLIKQIIVCFLIYGVFYVVSNRDYFLSQEFRDKAEKVTSQNEMLHNSYNFVMSYVDKYIGNKTEENLNTENIEEKQEEIKEKNEQQQDNADDKKEEQQENLDQNKENEAIINQTSEVSSENIGGTVENVESVPEKSQEEKDAEEIKNTINFIKPINGVISSTFGWRTPSSSIVSKYHTGIDLAANTGTIIKSATDGVVVLSSSEGGYGNHLNIKINDVTIIYAHCSKLYLKEGDKVTQGQEIAEVGSTGNSTGPHLHFEIRKEERYVDPQLILNF